MTQLMLFDASPSNPSVSFPVPDVKSPITTSVSEPRRLSIEGSLPVYDPQVGELHRMGDLARLVLARYDIVAQRRRLMRERRLAVTN